MGHRFAGVRSRPRGVDGAGATPPTGPTWHHLGGRARPSRAVVTRRGGETLLPQIRRVDATRRTTQPSSSPARDGLGRTMVLADGRTLGFDDVGDPDGPVVLYLHGFGSSRVVRHPDDHVPGELGFRMIAVDRPGIGLSTGAPGRRLLDWPRDVQQLVDRLGIDRFAVLGWSGGGPVRTRLRLVAAGPCPAHRAHQRRRAAHARARTTCSVDTRSPPVPRTPHPG